MVFLFIILYLFSTLYMVLIEDFILSYIGFPSLFKVDNDPFSVLQILHSIFHDSCFPASLLKESQIQKEHSDFPQNGIYTFQRVMTEWAMLLFGGVHE